MMIPGISPGAHWHVPRPHLFRRTTLDQTRAILQTADIVPDNGKAIPSISELRGPGIFVVTKLGPGLSGLRKLAKVIACRR
jgi:hypothetical protein